MVLLSISHAHFLPAHSNGFPIFSDSLLQGTCTGNIYFSFPVKLGSAPVSVIQHNTKIGGGGGRGGDTNGPGLCRTMYFSCTVIGRMHAYNQWQGQELKATYPVPTPNSGYVHAERNAKSFMKLTMLPRAHGLGTAWPCCHT